MPLFISSHSSVIETTRYLLGLRPDAPHKLTEFTMNHSHGDFTKVPGEKAKDEDLKRGCLYLARFPSGCPPRWTGIPSSQTYSWIARRRSAETLPRKSWCLSPMDRTTTKKMPFGLLT